MAMTFEKTWAFDTNRQYTPASAVDITRRMMWYLAATLTGNVGGLTQGLWTLRASSDSVSAGYDTTDRWNLAGVYDGTKIVRGVNHSWIVLRSPSINGYQWEMLLSFSTAADAAFRISFSRGAFTGGNITSSPTNATYQYFPVSSTPGTATDATINDGLVADRRFSVGLSSEGDFYFI